MNPINQVIERIIQMLRRVQQIIDRITAIVNAMLKIVPAVMSYIIDRVKEGWNQMLAKLAEFWDWFTDKLSYVGDPFKLNGAADGWKQMGTRVSRINDTIQDFNLAVDDEWTGRAADQYKQILEPQRRANTSILSDYAENVAGAMTGMANAIIAFWVAIVAAIIALLSALAGAATAAGTIIGLPAAPVLIVLGIVAFLVAAGGGVAILYVAAGSAKSTIASTGAGISTWPKLAAT
ncbi:hypothetical protein GCM10027515_28780 [Schumannella luteola]|uniref:Uncharacterized protein n=1 Tax=Schumannella luteola TaxID=472059 RepID=A0A852YA35_9MICO|nr:hypothetical protein [Schumannella luteola]NYG99323.1 hypothetical protein [Schumannella luteola]TPX06056.1 hypothetical protein FJ656_02665 [Schumannella luteola]